jgi:hypothetical protein
MPMLVPTTTLDRVYSDPAATERSWEQARKVLAIWFSTGAVRQAIAP